MFSGDFLFAGSIGRTDLAGGSHPQMLESLRTRVLPLADDVVVLPGHGPQSSIGRERATNPFLAELMYLMASKLSGFPEFLPARAHRRAAGARPPAPHLRAARLRQHRDPCGRAARRPAAQGRDRQRGLRGQASGRRRGRAGRAGAALRPDRPVRALRARERRQAGVPVPPLADPEGLAGRASPAGTVPRVHPGRHRHRRPRRAAVPLRRRGRPRHGRGAGRAADPHARRCRSATARCSRASTSGSVSPSPPL